MTEIDVIQAVKRKQMFTVMRDEQIEKYVHGQPSQPLHSHSLALVIVSAFKHKDVTQTQVL